MISPTGLPPGLAINAQNLDRLRAHARQSPEHALKAIAQQFEAVFMNMMLKSMREATPQDGVFDSEQTRMFTGMLDQQLAQNMSSQGIGLADIMVKQLGREFSSDATTRQQALSAMRSSHASELTSAYNENMQLDFIRHFAPYATQASRETGVPAPLILGQAALESGWGQREILMQDGKNSFNLFGIKAGNNWDGQVAEVVTTEYKNGLPGLQIEKFRAYNSYAEAFSDYTSLLRDNPRYAQVLHQGQTVPDAAYALQHAGYATDPNYADKLVKVLRTIQILG